MQFSQPSKIKVRIIRRINFSCRRIFDALKKTQQHLVLKLKNLNESIPYQKVLINYGRIKIEKKSLQKVTEIAYVTEPVLGAEAVARSIARTTSG